MHLFDHSIFYFFTDSIIHFKEFYGFFIEINQERTVYIINIVFDNI